MKKLVILVALITMLCLVMTSCYNTDTTSDSKTENVKSSKDISDYITENDDGKYIVLPKSKEKVKIYKDYLPFVDEIDVDLLISAEEKITKELERYSTHAGFHINVYESYLCLSAEVIVEIEPTLAEGESGILIDHEHKFFRERITKEKIDLPSYESTLEFYANHVLGTRIWDSRLPDDEDNRTVIALNIPGLSGLKVEYDTENFKVKVGDKEFCGDTGYCCIGLYHADLTGDGCPELCFVTSFGSGIVNESIEIYDATTDKFIFKLEDRGHYDYSLFIRNGFLCVKETEYTSGKVTRTGVLGNNGKEVTVFWDDEPNTDFDR